MTRIIAGAAKGRRLAVPPAGTRPTSDRAREGLFNSLAARLDLDGARVLDLFAGSGAVGLEALSRGAGAAVLVESNARAVEVIRRNVDAVGLPGAQVVNAPVTRYLDRDRTAADSAAPDSDRFDLIFADPPYAYDLPQLVDLATAAQPHLADDGLLVVETSTRVALCDAAISVLTWTDEKRYGETRFCYGRRR